MRPHRTISYFFREWHGFSIARVVHSAGIAMENCMMANSTFVVMYMTYGTEASHDCNINSFQRKCCIMCFLLVLPHPSFQY